MTLPFLKEQSTLGGLVEGLGLGAQQSLPTIQEMIMSRQKQKQKEDLLKGIHMKGSAGLGMEDLLKMSNAGLEKEAAIMAPFILAEQKSRLKQEGESQEKRGRAENILSTIKQSEELLPYTGSTLVPGKSFGGGSFNREAVEKRDEFDALSAQYANFFRDLDTKGQLPLGMYEKVIEPRLPNSKLSERQNRGRLRAIRSLAKKYGGITEEKGGSSTLKTPERKKALTEDVISQIFKEAGEDWEKATKLAKERGYEF